MPIDAGAVRTTTTATTITTTSVRPVMSTSTPQPQLQRSTTIAPVTAVRRPGTTGSGTTPWRKQQLGDENNNSKSEFYITSFLRIYCICH